MKIKLTLMCHWGWNSAGWTFSPRSIKALIRCLQGIPVRIRWQPLQGEPLSTRAESSRLLWAFRRAKWVILPWHLLKISPIYLSELIFCWWYWAEISCDWASRALVINLMTAVKEWLGPSRRDLMKAWADSIREVVRWLKWGIDRVQALEYFSAIGSQFECIYCWKSGPYFEENLSKDARNSDWIGIRIKLFQCWIISVSLRLSLISLEALVSIFFWMCHVQRRWVELGNKFDRELMRDCSQSVRKKSGWGMLLDEKLSLIHIWRCRRRG